MLPLKLADAGRGLLLATLSAREELSSQSAAVSQKTTAWAGVGLSTEVVGAASHWSRITALASFLVSHGREHASATLLSQQLAAFPTNSGSLYQK